MRLRLGYLARQEGIRPGSNGRLEVAVRPARAPRYFFYSTIRRPNLDYRVVEHLANVFGQLPGTGKLRRAQKSEVLLAETARRTVHRHKSEHAAKLRVVAQLGVGIQRQVVGDEIDVVLEQQGQALPHPARDRAILTAPEQPVVHKDRVGPHGDRRLHKRKTGSDAGHDPQDLRAPLHLQPVGPVVPEALGLQQAVQVVKQLLSGGHALTVAKRRLHFTATDLHTLPMRRIWLIFSQAATVLLAAWFVVATLKPEWLGRYPGSSALMPLQEAPAASAATMPAGSLRTAAQKASAAVVSINISKAAGKNPRSNDPWFRFFFGEQDSAPQTGLGSGVIVSPNGYILTNNHVVEGADEIEVVLNDSRRVRAKVIGTDPDSDLGVLKIELDRLPAIVLGSPDAVQVGDQVLAIGNPFGVGQTVTSGIVSALGRNQLGINTFENFIQTDAAINPGNSGGALVDVNGHLVGINTAIYSRSGGSMGIGFAIPVSTAKAVLEGIVKDGVVTRGWIGVEPQDVSPELAETFGVKAREGVVITGVLQNGPAALAGIKPGDVITAVAGKSVGNVSELLSGVAALKPGNPARFKLLRRDERLELDVTPGLRPRPKAAPAR